MREWDFGIKWLRCFRVRGWILYVFFIFLYGIVYGGVRGIAIVDCLVFDRALAGFFIFLMAGLRDVFCLFRGGSMRFWRSYVVGLRCNV